MNKKVEMGKQYKSSTPGGLFYGRAFRRVLAVDCVGILPVAIELDDGEVYKFTEYGYRLADNINNPYNLIEVTPYADFKKDEQVMVSENGVDWHPRHFDKEVDGVAYCFDNGRTSWTGDISLYPWNYYRRPTEEELKENEMERLIVAHTDTKFGDHPAFINVYEAKHDGVVVNIRGARKQDGTSGDCATIEIDTSALLDLVPAIVKHFDWLPGWVAEYNAAQKRKDEIEALKQQLYNTQFKLTEAEYRDDRIKRKLESWYQP